MNIKEVEKEVGIRKANIRYYEDQGLIAPKRNSENNYRDYSNEDVIFWSFIFVPFRGKHAASFTL